MADSNNILECIRKLKAEAGHGGTPAA